MGELSDDITEGVVCELCGSFYEESHGYPCVCEDCWLDLTSQERKNYQKAHHRTID